MHSLWAVAFRPFFLAASVFASLALVLWVLVLSGAVFWRLDAAWHGHELLYGFFTAVLCGFLLTAAKNWASLPADSGPRLWLIFGAWVLGRVCAFAPSTGPLSWARLASVLAPVLLFFYLLRFLRQPAQKNNRVFLIAVALFGLGDLVSLLPSPVSGMPFLNRSNGLWLGLHVSQWLIVLMSAKTMPLFVERAVGKPIRSWPVVERVSSWGVIAAMAADFLDAPAVVLAVASLVAAAANSIRLWGFHPLRGLGSRLLFPVVFGYLCLVGGYVGLAVVSWRGLPVSMVLHLFTAGAVSSLVYAIMSRIALGHTGRPIAVPGVLLAGYLLVVLGGSLRILAGLWPGAYYLVLLQAGGSALAVAWVLYAVWSAPFLVAPRVDGKPG